MNKLPPLVVIAGPTASGKSALAMALSRLVPSTIVNADASQVYADLRILTARPSEADEAEVPHALFGHVDGARAYNVAEWAADAKLAIAKSHAAARLPILVGGTGLYIRTLIDGIAPVPVIDSAVREAVRALPVSEAHAELAREDANAAARLNAADATRVARALEVVRSTGRTLFEWQQQREGGIGESVRLAPLILLPPREWLYQRCDARFGTMLAGAREEVAALLARNLDPALSVMRAIGVRELAALLHGLHSAVEATEAGRLATRQYAKRQYTWFGRQPPGNWPRYSEQEHDGKLTELAIKLRSKVLT